MDFYKEALNLKDEVIALRRDFHKHPEVDYNLHRTSSKIREILEKNGIQCEISAKVGVVALIKGSKGEGKTIAIRGDMDALPLKDMKDCSYKSTINGCMHGCGHDAHMTIALGTAMILNKYRDKFYGNVKMIFEPAEETTGGAVVMIKEGVLLNPKVDAVIGLHVSEDIECGKVGVKYDTFNAASNPFKITIKGKGGHGAHPENTKDPIIMAAQLINALQTVVSREISPHNPSVITIGAIDGGTAANIIPESVCLKGIIRTITPEDRDFAVRRLKDISRGIVNSLGGEVDITMEESYPCLINDNNMVRLIEQSSKVVVGEKNIIKLKYPSMGVESFAYFAMEVPSAFYNLGTRNEEKGIVHPAHGSLFDIDEDALAIGVAVQCTAAMNFLNS